MPIFVNVDLPNDILNGRILALKLFSHKTRSYHVILTTKGPNFDVFELFNEILDQCGGSQRRPVH